MATVVVLTYSAGDGVLGSCLRSVATAADTDAIVLVDNGRCWTPDTVAALLAATPDARSDLNDGADPSDGTDPADRADRAGLDGLPVTVVRSHRNLGFAGGVNAGLSVALEAGATELAILNDDTTVAPDWITRLRRHLAGATGNSSASGADVAGDAAAAPVGAVQPKLLLDDGRVQSVGVTWRRDGAGIDIGYGEPDDGRHDRAGTIRCFTGGAALFTRDFLTDVGGFDERFHLYYEDIDLSLRGGAAGYRFVVEPAAVVRHAMSHTTAADPDGRRYHQERNRLWCLARHGSIADLGAGLARSLARGAKHRSGPQWRAIGDGVAGVPTRRRERRAGTLRVTPLPLPANRRAWEIM